MLIALKTFKMRSYSKDQRTDVSKELELERNNRVRTSRTRRGKARYGHMSARTQTLS